MSPSASTAEVPLEVPPVKPKRKPRAKVCSGVIDEVEVEVEVEVKVKAADLSDDINTAAISINSSAEFPPKKIPRQRRSKADAALVLSAAMSADDDTDAVSGTVHNRDAADIEPAAAEFASAQPSIFLPHPGDVIKPIAITTQQLSADHARLSSAIRAGRVTNLSALGPEAQIMLSMPAPAGDAVQPDSYRALVLTLPSGQIEVADGVRLLRVLTGIDLGLSAIESPHAEWLHSAVIGRLRATPLSEVIAISRGCLPPDQNDPSVQPLLLTLCSDQHRLSMQVRACTACWLDVLVRGGWQRLQMPFDTLDHIPLHLPLVIASHTLSSQMTAGLVAGDVLLPDTTWFDCAGVGVLRWRGRQLRVQFSAPAALTIIDMESGMVEQTEIDKDDLQAYSNHAARSEPGGASGAFDGVPILLQFEMGRCNATLGQLRTLISGSVLPIEGGSPAVVAILANGRKMGHGELVDINGQLGIRIVDIVSVVDQA